MYRSTLLRGTFGSIGLSYMVAPRRTQDLSRSTFLQLDLPLCSARGTLQYVAAPLLVPARGSSLRWLLDRVWAALTSTHMYEIFSTYTLVPGSVSIHNLRTVYRIASGSFWLYWFILHGCSM